MLSKERDARDTCGARREACRGVFARDATERVYRHPDAGGRLAEGFETDGKDGFRGAREDRAEDGKVRVLLFGGAQFFYRVTRNPDQKSRRRDAADQARRDRVS